MTALKIPFFPLGLRFPAGDVLNAVIIFRTNNFYRPDCLLSPFSFSPFLSLCLKERSKLRKKAKIWILSQSLFSFLDLFSQPLYKWPMTNDQWPMTILCLIFWSWKNKPPSSPRIGKWVKYQTPNHKSQIAKPISAKLSPVFLLYLFSQSFFSASLQMTNDQWPVPNDHLHTFILNFVQLVTSYLINGDFVFNKFSLRNSAWFSSLVFRFQALIYVVYPINLWKAEKRW